MSTRRRIFAILLAAFLAVFALAFAYRLYRGFQDPKQHFCRTVSECMDPEANAPKVADPFLDDYPQSASSPKR